MTEASGRGIGAMLTQEFESPLSRKLSPAETRHSTIKREALVVKYSFKRPGRRKAWSWMAMEVTHSKQNLATKEAAQKVALGSWLLPSFKPLTVM